MIASDVPTAVRIVNASATASVGTIRKPPPTPKKPVTKPTATPASEVAREPQRRAASASRLGVGLVALRPRARSARAAASMIDARSRRAAAAGDRLAGERAERRCRGSPRP